MTPTDAREFMAGTFGPARARTVITKLADQVEALTKERDALIVEVVAEKAKKTIWQKQYEAAIEQRDALAAAAKLALDALDAFAEWEDMGDPQRPATEAIAALRQAGVQ